MANFSQYWAYMCRTDRHKETRRTKGDMWIFECVHCRRMRRTPVMTLVNLLSRRRKDASLLKLVERMSEPLDWIKDIPLVRA